MLAWASFRIAEQKIAGLGTANSGRKLQKCNPLRQNCDIAATGIKFVVAKHLFSFVHRSHGLYKRYLGVVLQKIMKQGRYIFGGKARRFASYCAVGSLLLSPVLVPAVAAQLQNNDSGYSLSNWATQFTPAGIDSRLAERMRGNAVRENGFPFTPAGLNSRSSNILTVAARADGSNSVSVRNAMAQMEIGTGTTLRLNNSNYQLTTARGWQAFQLPTSTVEQPRIGDILGNGNFRLDDAAKKKPSRFNTDVKVASPRGATPSLRGNEAAAGDYSVNLGGSFRVAKGVDVTAGVRYSRDSDRVDPATAAQADSEAVYVGTKIKF